MIYPSFDMPVESIKANESIGAEEDEITWNG
jgi:hypothetical protein